MTGRGPNSSLLRPGVSKQKTKATSVQNNGNKNNKSATCRTKCCVGGCENTQNKRPDLTFYSFPNEVREKEARIEWIRRIRKTLNDESWSPSRYCTVCSIHFIRGVKSKNPSSQRSMPMIFPSYKFDINKIHERRETEIAGNHSPTSCHAQPQINLAEPEIKIEPEFIEIKTEEFIIPSITDDYQTETLGNNHLTRMKLKKASKKVQTDPDFKSISELVSRPKRPNVLFSWSNGNDLNIQTDIHVDIGFTLSSEESRQKDKVVVQCYHKPDDFGFRGVQNIQSDITMVSLAGVTQNCFKRLLEVIVPGQDGQCKYFTALSKENRLLVLLMKLKLGLPFAALSCLFCLNQMTINKIFHQMLMTLALRTKSWISWPAKTNTKKLTKTLSVYPNCRCIIELLEIETDLQDRIKFLLCFAPDGLICKVSKAYARDDSDIFIARDSGFLDDVDPGDTVLASRDFPEIEVALRDKDVTLVSASDSRSTCIDGNKKGNVSVEIRNIVKTIYTLKILSNKIPNNLVPCVSDIVQVCCVIVNGHFPLESEK